MGDICIMKDLQSLLATLDRDPKSGMLLPTLELAEMFREACPLSAGELHTLARCLEECSEQIYEFYRPMIDTFRAEVMTGKPDEETLRIGLRLGILDDEALKAKEV